MTTNKKRITALLVACALSVSAALPAGVVSKAAVKPVDRTGFSVQKKEAADSDMIRQMLDAADYVEGEAIAIVKNGSAYIGEKTLSVVDSDAVELTVDGTTESSDTIKKMAKKASARLTDGDNAKLFIKHIKDPARSTEDILKELYSDPDVISAEPNYVLDEPEVTEYTDSLSASSSVDGADTKDGVTTVKSDKTSAKAVSAKDSTYDPKSIGDLSRYQWYISSEGTEKVKTPTATQGLNQSLNIPGWNKTEDNASGTVAIMDTGLDVTHPDLKDSLYTFTEEQQQKYGCGPHGINMEPANSATPEEENRRDVQDNNGHGTHLAGIVAGAWNGYGVSGIVKGAKVFSVKVYSNDGGGQESTDVVRGFDWLAKVAKEVNLKAVNVSLGSLKSQLVHTIMVNKLGAQGVNVVYASGNSNMDMDEKIDMGGQNNSPYAIKVNASDPDGKKVSFSCYGRMTTDVFAPGVQMVSTIPTELKQFNDENKYINYADNTRVYPENTDPSHIANGRIEKFADDRPEVLMFDVCPVNADGSDNNKAKQIGSKAQGVGVDDDTSWQLRWKDMEKRDEGHYMKDSYPVGSNFWMAVPVEDGKDADWIAYTAAVNDTSHLTAGLSGVMLSQTTKTGSKVPLQVDMSVDLALSGSQAEIDPSLVRGLVSAATYNIGSVSWSPCCMNLKAFVDEIKYVNEKLTEKQRETLLVNGSPGEADGLFIWEKDGKKYILVQYATILGEEGDAFGDDTMLYMDNIAVTDKDAACGAYMYMSGTSMSAPSIAASLAVIAKDEPASATLTDEELQKEALERAAKLMACVDYKDEFKDLCSTGGMVNLHSQTAFTKKAPLLTRAEETEGTLTLDGFFFGNSGKLYIDDAETVATQWTDRQITADVSGLSAGSHYVMVINSDEVRRQIVFSVSGSVLYEKDHALPIRDPAFVTDQTDMMSGDMVSNGKYIFVMSADTNNLSRALWRYDIKADTWKRCADIPKHILGDTTEINGMVIKGGKLYIYTYRKGLDSRKGELWCYDIKADKWKRAFSKNLPEAAQIFAVKKQVFLIYNRILYKLNVKNGKLKKLKTKAPFFEIVPETQIAVSGNKVYMYGYEYTGNFDRKYHLYRYIYKKKKSKFIKEDLTSAINKAFGKNAYESALAGTPKGAVFVGLHTDANPGKDTYFIKNGKKKITPLSKVACYHEIFYPMAVYDAGRLYVMGVNDTEPDTLFFRSTKM